MDLSDLKFWSAIAGMIAMAILAVVALAGYDQGCAPNGNLAQFANVYVV
jgi:hypothetical protein